METYYFMSWNTIIYVILYINTNKILVPYLCKNIIINYNLFETPPKLRLPVIKSVNYNKLQYQNT